MHTVTVADDKAVEVIIAQHTTTTSQYGYDLMTSCLVTALVRKSSNIRFFFNNPVL